MYGRGSHALNQASQGIQPPRPPPNQQHLYNAFPPPTQSLTPAAAQTVIHHGGFVAGPTVPNHGAPFYSPRGGLPSTFRPPYVPMRQPVSVYENMTMPSMYPNSQQNVGFASRGENQNAHHGASPMPPLPPAILTGSSQRQPLPPPSALPPPPPFPPKLSLPPPPSRLHGPQIQLPTAAQSSVLLPPPPPPLPTSSPPSLPPLPSSSLSMLLAPMPHVSSARLHPESDADPKVETTPALACEATHSESLRKVSEAQECRRLESNSKYVLEGSFESRLSPAPPQPKQKEIVKRIEVLCQFIAKNGSNFEEMAKKRESGNPEFEFLFGGEPGSDAALAHDYFQWIKKKCLSAANSQEDGKFSTSRSWNVFSASHSKHSMPLSSADLNTDSDMEMEDDITPVDKDQRLKVPVDDLSEVSDLFHDRNGVKQESPLQLNVDQPPSVEEFSSQNLPRNEAQSSSDLERAARITGDGKSERNMKRVGPLRIIQDDAFNDSSEDGLTALSPASGSDKSDKSESKQDLQSRVLSENANGAASLYLYKGQNVPNSSPEARSKVERITRTFSSGCITNKHSNGSPIEDVIKATSHSWIRKSDAGSETDGNRRGPCSKEKVDERLSAMKVDEFGRLVREGVSDSESDDMNYQGRPKRRGRSRSSSRSWSMSPIDRRRRRHITERRRDKRSRSRSWSPRSRRNRSRSPFSRRGNIRQDNVRIKECFNFRRGKCYRGASCRYSHHDVELGRLRYQRRRPHFPEMSVSPDIRAAGKAKEMPSGPLLKNEVENHTIRAYGDLPHNSRDEKEMKPLIGPSQAYCSNVEGCASQATLDKPEEVVFQCKDRGADQELAVDGSNDRPTTSGDSHGHVADNVHRPPKNFAGDSSPSGQSLSDPENTDHLSQLTDINRLSALVPLNPQLFVPSMGTAGLPQPHGSNGVQPYSSYPPRPPLTGVLPYVLPGNQNLSPTPQNSTAAVVPPPQPLPCSQFNAVAPGRPMSLGMYLEPNMADSTNFSSQSSMPQHPSHGQAYSHMGGFPQGPTRPFAETYRGLTLSTVELPSIAPQMQPYLQHGAPIPDSEYGRNFTNPDAPNPSSSTYAPDLTDIKQTYGKFTAFVHHNPYASTFERPMISAFNSSSLGQVYPNTNRYSDTLHATSASADAEGVHMSRQAAHLPHFTIAMHESFARSGVDQYDPLFDSVDPSSNYVHQDSRLQRNEAAGDTDARMSGSNEPFKTEENNRKKEFEVFAPSTSIDDGFGETAEAEVGAVDNASLSGSMDPPIRDDGDFEIDQVKSPGKSKKRRESRSVKLFKISIADFVKEVLRPSWRQGNMSKEAFKTIVKKTVDKVAGAMKGHRIPKSQAKINQYIDSSNRKLTKLVMGYVDKYVKV